MKPVDWGKLSQSFARDEVKWRVLQAGKTNGKVWARVVSYVDRAQIEERLDQAVGPDGWQCRYERQGDAIVCTLSIRTEEGWIGKSDAAGIREVEDSSEDFVKTAYTEAFKRAAVKWGIGRELYKREESWAVIREDGKGQYRGKLKDGTVFSWDPPRGAISHYLPTQKEEMAIHGSPKDPVAIGVAFSDRNGHRSYQQATGTVTLEQIPKGSKQEPPKNPLQDELEKLEDEIIQMLRKYPFTPQDEETALNVFPKIETVYGMKSYKRQWEEEYLKRIRKSK